VRAPSAADADVAEIGGEDVLVSETVLRIIPTLPDWTPAEADVDAAAAIVRVLCPDAVESIVVRYAEVAFIDQGANFDRVSCPVCGAVLDEAWWQERMDEAFATRFSALGVMTPCSSSGISAG
jgi:hypothetical protein